MPNFVCRSRKKRHAGACRPKRKKPGASCEDRAYFPCLHPIGVDWREAFHFPANLSAKIAVTGRPGRTPAHAGIRGMGYTSSFRSRNSLHPCADECSPPGRHPPRGVFCADAGLGNHIKPLRVSFVQDSGPAPYPAKQHHRPKIPYTTRLPGATSA